LERLTLLLAPVDAAFTGQRQDTASGFAGDYDFLYREYNTQGRWASPDPAGLGAVASSNPQSWNRYAYVMNNPPNSVDPWGLDDCADFLHNVGGDDGFFGTSGCTEMGPGGGSNGGPTGGGAPPCYDGGLCADPSGIPGIYNASYNGPVPDWKYFQGLGSKGIAMFLTMVTTSVYNAPLPAGVLNGVTELAKGYSGGEIDLGFKLAIKQLRDDVTSGIFPPEVDEMLKDWLSTVQSEPSLKPNPVGSCNMLVSLVMSPWKAALQAWLKDHPGQQPPPEIGNLPSLPACAI
jgi:RHS repeat-associated protein